MIKIKNKKKFIIFAVILACFLASGVYLVTKIINLSEKSEESPEKNESYQEGISKLSEGDFDSASEFLEKAVNEDSDPEKIKMLAVSQYNQKNYDEAEKNFEKLIKEDKDNASIYYNSLANIYRDKKEFEKSIEYYQKSIDIDPKYETAYQNLAILYLYEIDPRDPEKAKEIIEQGLENLPDSDVLKKMQ